MKNIKLLLLSIGLIFLANSCKKEADISSPQTTTTTSANQHTNKHFNRKAGVYAAFPETFESASKTAYASADVTLATGTWNLDDALLGTSASDAKTGSKSVRIRNTGMLTMNYDLTDGATEVSIAHAVYGSDGNSTWDLYYSTNSGSTWTKTGNTITSSSTTLSTATFTVNISGNVRFQLRKISGGSSRINIDDFSITDNIGGGVVVANFPETFESASKTAYAAGDVTLTSGTWNLDDALLGTSASDAKTDAKSVRIRNTGLLTMNFDITTGASEVSIAHAVYGSDGSSTWDLYYSTNSGSTWTKTGNTITSSSTTLSTATFTMAISGNVRFQLRKISGGSNRINIDDFSITDNGGGGSGGGGSGTATRDDNMGMGNPSGATTNTSNMDNYLMEKTQYTLSYNNSKGGANWVSWHLSSAWLGSAARCNCFTSDNTLPSGYFKATTSNYTNTGFDRGHLCPSADRNGSSTDNSATFLMTNIMPQAPNLNQQGWANLEDYCRTLTSQGNELYIISGGYGQGGSGSLGGTTNTIAGGSINVPDHYWKVIVVLPIGTNDASRVSTSTRVIAIDMPNTQSVSSTWGSYRTSVDAIEAATGYDFLTNVSTTIQSSIEATVDSGPTN